MNPRDRKRRERRSLLGALALLLAVAAGWWFLSSRREEVRQAALAGVPDFPQPGQAETRRTPAQKAAPRAAPKPLPAAPSATRKADRLNAFALAPAHTVAVIQVNALFNTPLFDRFRECEPAALKSMEAAAAKEGLDLERDIDRIAMIPSGIAVSGFFEGKPFAESLARGASADGAEEVTYRDQTVWNLKNGSCAVQMGNLMLIGPDGNCQSLIDRALDPPADENAGSELYGDLYLRSDLGELGAGDPAGAASSDPFAQLLGSLSGVTMRANVWDDVAVSVEGSPKSGEQLRDLTQMARGALSVAKGQIGDDDDGDKMQALAELAQVNSADGKLKIDLALPADQLFSRLHIPCPGLEDAGTHKP